jgi:hypothetical protein
VFIVVQVAPDWSWMAPASAWDHFRTGPVIDRGEIPVGDFVLFGALAVGGWAAALWAFRRRDLAACGGEALRRPVGSVRRPSPRLTLRTASVHTTIHTPSTQAPKPWTMRRAGPQTC